MSKRKKKGGKVQPEQLINLTTHVIALITALVLLYEKLTS